MRRVEPRALHWPRSPWVAVGTYTHTCTCTHADLHFRLDAKDLGSPRTHVQSEHETSSTGQNGMVGYCTGSVRFNNIHSACRKPREELDWAGRRPEAGSSGLHLTAPAPEHGQGWELSDERTDAPLQSGHEVCQAGGGQEHRRRPAKAGCIPESCPAARRRAHGQRPPQLCL